MAANLVQDGLRHINPATIFTQSQKIECEEQDATEDNKEADFPIGLQPVWLEQTFSLHIYRFIQHSIGMSAEESKKS